MKKFVCALFAGMLMTTTVFAGGVNVVVNNNPIELEGTIVDGRTLVPVRGVFESLGYAVDFDANTKTAILSGKNSITMTQGNTYFTVDGRDITPDVPQQIIDGRFMLPLRAVSEAIGAQVNWDANTKTASVTQSVGLIVKDLYVPGED